MRPGTEKRVHVQRLAVGEQLLVAQPERKQPVGQLLVHGRLEPADAGDERVVLFIHEIAEGRDGYCGAGSFGQHLDRLREDVDRISGRSLQIGLVGPDGQLLYPLSFRPRGGAVVELAELRPRRDREVGDARDVQPGVDLLAGPHDVAPVQEVPAGVDPHVRVDLVADVQADLRHHREAVTRFAADVARQR